jgi:hypothetical protein
VPKGLYILISSLFLLYSHILSFTFFSSQSLYFTLNRSTISRSCAAGVAGTAGAGVQRWIFDEVRTFLECYAIYEPRFSKKIERTAILWEKVTYFKNITLSVFPSSLLPLSFLPSFLFLSTLLLVFDN